MLRLYRDSFSGLRREVWLLSLVSLINRSGAMVLPFMAIYLRQELGISLSMVGWAMACFGLGSIIGSFLGGWITDRTNYYDVQFWSLLVTGCMFLLLMTVKTFEGFCVAIFFTSLLADTYRPANMTAIGVYSKPENRTRALTLNRLAINLGFSIGPALGGILAGTLGYDWLFVVDGLTCIGAAFFFRFFLPRRAAIKTSDANRSTTNTSYLVVLKDRFFLFFVFFEVLAIMSFFQFLSTLPMFWKEELGLSETAIGNLMALNGLLIVVIEMPLIFSLEKKHSHLLWTSMGALLIGLGYFSQAIPGIGWWGALALILFITVGEMVNFPFSNTVALSRANDANRGRYMGVYTMSFSLCHILASVLGAQIAGHFGYTALWLTMGACALVSALGLRALHTQQLEDKRVAVPHV
ncbi:MAG: MFS transporter [Bacteroidia bacterium]